MMKRIRKTQHKCRQAFTLVELIVVLVVLAILAGILVPALTGYIKQGKKVKYIQEVDAYRTAAQAVMAEWYGHNGERIDYRDIFWDKNDDNGKWGEKVLNLMGYSRGEKNGEPYILVIGVGYPTETGLSEAQKYGIYYVGYVRDKKAPAIFYVNGEYIYTYPTEKPVYVKKEGTNPNITNTIVMPKGTNIRIQYFVISNRTGQNDGNFWRNGANSLLGHSESYKK